MTDFRAQGIDTSFIIAALGEICVKAARSEPEHAAMYLESLIAVLGANAQAARGKKVLDLAAAILGNPE